MVNALEALTTLSAPGLMAATGEKAQPLLWRLDPQQRANVLMALLGVVLVGMGLVAVAILGGRYAMRLARKRSGPTTATNDLWYRKPLVPGERPKQDPPSN